MRTIPVRRVLAAAGLLVAAALGTSAGVSAAAAGQPSCAVTWGSLERANDSRSTAALANVRTGPHDCYDRVVLDFTGPATGYDVGYADQVLSEGRGEPLTVAGGARLRVALQEPAYDVETGAPTFAHAAGDHVAGVAGDRTLRDVVFGGTFEGHTTLAIGVRARLPFRVLTLPGPGAGSRIVIDVAHRWSA